VVDIYPVARPEILHHKKGRHQGSGGVASISLTHPLFTGAWADTAGGVLLSRLRTGLLPHGPDIDPVGPLGYSKGKLAADGSHSRARHLACRSHFPKGPNAQTTLEPERLRLQGR
jgi:hypothetical protein